MSGWKGKAIFPVVVVALLIVPSTAHGYLGPGGVLTAIGSMLALFAAVVAALAGFLWYPLKRLLAWARRVLGRTKSQAPAPTSTSETSGR